MGYFPTRRSWTLHQLSLVSLDPHRVASAACGRYMLTCLASIGVGFVMCFAKCDRPSRKLYWMNICKYVCS